MARERWLHMSRRSCVTIRRAYTIYGVLLVIPFPFAATCPWSISVESYNSTCEPLVVGLTGISCFLATFLSYYNVFKLIHHHQQQIQAKQLSHNPVQPNINLAKYKKSVNTILSILAIFVLSYVPHIITLTNNFQGNLYLNLLSMFHYRCSSCHLRLILFRTI